MIPFFRRWQSFPRRACPRPRSGAGVRNRQVGSAATRRHPTSAANMSDDASLIRPTFLPQGSGHARAGGDFVMGKPHYRISSDDSLVPAAVPGRGLARPPLNRPPRRANAPKGQRPGAAKWPGAVRVSTPPPARASAKRGGPWRRLGSLVLLAAALVLWAGTALAQTPTVTMSPTGSLDITEGDAATAFSVTVANMPQSSTANFGVIEIQKIRRCDIGRFQTV